MFVPMIRNPGTHLTGFPTMEEAQTVGMMLHLAEDGLADCAVALDLFCRASEAAGSDLFAEAKAVEGLSPGDQWRARRDAYEKKRDEVDARIPHPALPPDADAKTRDDARRARDGQIELVVAVEYWLEGRVPSEYRHRAPAMHAKSFLYALDGTAKAIGVLTNPKTKIVLPSPADEKVVAHLAACNARFPHLQAVRNSAHHPEDRVRGKKTGEKDITLQPVLNGPVRAPQGGVLITGSLNGNLYGETMADGYFGEVEVSVATLIDAAKIVQDVFDSFDWTGHPHWKPHAF